MRRLKDLLREQFPARWIDTKDSVNRTVLVLEGVETDVFKQWEGDEDEFHRACVRKIEYSTECELQAMGILLRNNYEGEDIKVAQSGMTVYLSHDSQVIFSCEFEAYKWDSFLKIARAKLWSRSERRPVERDQYEEWLDELR